MGSDFFAKLTEASSEAAVKEAKQLLKQRRQIYLLPGVERSVTAGFFHKGRYDRVQVYTDGSNRGECSCGNFKAGKLCCHAVAAILGADSQRAIQSPVKPEPPPKYAGLQYHDLAELAEQPRNQAPYRLYIQSENEFPHVPSKWEKALFTVKICGAKKQYTGNLGNLKELHFNKKLLAAVKLEQFSLQERQIIRFMAINAEMDGRRLALGAETAAEFLHCLTGYKYFTRNGRRIIIHHEHARPALLWHQQGNEIIARSALDINGVVLPLSECKVIMGRAGCWVGMRGEYWWTAATVDIGWMRSFFRAKPQHVPLSQLKQWRRLYENLPITVCRAEYDTVKQRNGNVIVEALILPHGLLRLKLSYCYDGRQLPADGGRIERGKDSYWQRDSELETKLESRLTAFGFAPTFDTAQFGWELANREAIGAFFDLVLPQWQQEGIPLLLTSATAALSNGGNGVPKLTVNTTVKQTLPDKYLLDCRFKAGKEIITWQQAAQVAEENGRYIITSAGRIADLGSALQKFLRGLGNIIKPGTDETAPLSLPRAAACYWYQAGRNIPGLVPDEFTNLLHSLHTPPPDEVKIIEKSGNKRRFTGELRPYQQEGVEWLHSMTQHGFNVILADEMGLGKTIQVLALLAKYSSGTSLIVCPSSLLANWRRESEKFVDGMKSLVIAGPRRKALWQQASQYDLLIVSYSIVKRDIEQIKKLYFDYVILDEAQHIKNPSTINAKSCKDINAAHRLVLTGTPLENSSTDLWSIFDFLAPGLLGSFRSFKKHYEAIGEDENLRRELQDRIGSFILRRTKERVCSELPPKYEQIIYCEMGREQRKLYDELFDYGRQLVQQQQPGDKKYNFAVLTTLLRLRQICCHPTLLPEMSDHKIASAKMELLHELILENIDSNHKMLIFSQFTSLLKIIRKWLDDNAITYEYLDGQSKQRQEKVDHFNNNPDIKLFLLSLKAGGVGLNLTSADTVILFDPWWNPAVEDQATDRTHRIGQKRIVNSIKLVMKDSIEEKIIRLQDSKQRLFDNLIEKSANRTKLSIEELKFLFS